MEMGNQKKNDGPGVIGRPPHMYSHYPASGQHPSQARMYATQPAENSFIQNFNSLNLRTSPNIPAQTPPAFFYNGQVVFAGNHIPQQLQNHSNMPQSPGIYAPVAPHFLASNFPAYQHNLGGHSPSSHAWTSRTTSSEMPSLATPRRDSSSSNEVDAPGTPFTAFTGFGEYQGGVAVVDRSPHSYYAYSTPSPPDAAHGYTHGKPHTQTSTPLEIQVLVQQEPAIPRGVPAPNSPPKPLNRCLENQNGVTNVYIRGLLPETTDEMLYSLAVRFGDIVSSKSIIDHNTGLCKGFGFVKYHNFKDAENCIRGFHFMGYETSFARESFYAQLKKLADDDNTNLYVSNLPKDMSEHELSAIFEPHKVCSSRILRDSAGNGRGVGFARFESRDICEEVIKAFNNTPLIKSESEEHLIQIRYADSKEQKSLKQQTTAARQYRTAEYEFATQARGSFYESASHLTSVLSTGSVIDNDFESYIANTTGTGNGDQNGAHHSGAGRFLARDRLGNVSSHLAISPLAMSGNAVVARVENSNLSPNTDEDKNCGQLPNPAAPPVDKKVLSSVKE